MRIPNKALMQYHDPMSQLAPDTYTEPSAPETPLTLPYASKSPISYLQTSDEWPESAPRR